MCICQKTLSMILSWTKGAGYMASIGFCNPEHNHKVVALWVLLCWFIWRFSLNLVPLSVIWGFWDFGKHNVCGRWKQNSLPLMKTERVFIIHISYTKTVTTYCLQNEMKSLETLKTHFQTSLSLYNHSTPAFALTHTNHVVWALGVHIPTALCFDNELIKVIRIKVPDCCLQVLSY